MLKWIVIIVLAAAGAVLALAATEPDAFRVERRIRIDAPAERVFGEISDFRHWKAWSPWETKDPAMQTAYGGAASGQGAVYEWSGNGAVGQGRMEIVEAVAPGRVRLKLDFTKPMEAHNEVVFTLVQDGAATEVSWVMSGTNNLVSKVMQVFFSMDRMVGGDFEAGLAALKAKAEAAGAR